VPLPDLCVEDLHEQAQAFFALLPFAELVPQDPCASQEAQARLRDTLAWLGHGRSSRAARH